jgi:SAM-dependent methyltransferase
MEQSRLRLDADAVASLFEKSYAPKQALAHIVGQLKPQPSDTLLLVNGGQAGLAMALGGGPGAWYSVHTDPDVAAVLRERFGDRALHVAGPRFPFEDNQFDAVVINDVIERQAEPGPWIAECHRVLKRAGRFVLHVPHTKRLAVLRSAERLFGLAGAGDEPPPRTFSPADVFELLKDGFDVQEEVRFSRFGVQFAESVARFVMTLVITGRRTRDVESAERLVPRLLKARSVIYPFSVIAGVADHLLFFTAGYYMVCRAKRRIWHPRRTPRLVDGRSIADATINTKIGTAGPFATGG